MSRKDCNGICIMGWEILEGGRGVAYAHPECELHAGYVEPERCPEADEHNRQCLEVEGHEPPCEFGPWPPEQVGDVPTAFCRHIESRNVSDAAAPLWRCDDCGHTSPVQWDGAPF